MRKLQTEILAELTWDKVVERLPNSHVRLTWDYYMFDLRTADLITLTHMLTEWLDHHELYTDFYALYLGEEAHIVLSAADVEQFHTLCQEALAELPRQIVRWQDTSFALRPLFNQVYQSGSRFSYN